MQGVKADVNSGQGVEAGVKGGYTQHIPQLAQTHTLAAPAPAPAAATPTEHDTPTQAAAPAPAPPRSKPPPVKRRPAAPLVIYPDTPADVRLRLLREAKAQVVADEEAHRAAEAAALQAHRSAEEAAQRDEEARVKAAEAAAARRVKAAEAAAERAAAIDAKQERLEAELLAVQRKRAGVDAAMEAASLGTKRDGRPKVARDVSEEDESVCSATYGMAPWGGTFEEAGASSMFGQLGREGQDAQDDLPGDVLQQMSAMVVLGHGFETCESFGEPPRVVRAAR